VDDRSNNAVLAVARDLLADLDLERVLQRVVDAAREVTGARYGALGVLSGDRHGLARFITSGLDTETRLAIGSLPTGRGVLGELIEHPVPLRLADIGAHVRSYGFPIGHPTMGSFLGAPIMIGATAYGNLYLTEKLGAAEFTVEDEETIVLLAEFAGLAIDHARQFAGSEQRREELQQTVAALDATLQIARALGGETDLPSILELVAKRGRALVAARALVIEHLKGDSLVIVAAAGDVPDLVGDEVEFAGSVASTAIETRATQRIEDEANRPRFERHGLGRLGLRASAGLVVPLVFRGQPYGVLVAMDRLSEGPAFSAEDVSLLEAFAASAATAVATAESVASEQQRQRLAAESERGRWARELHDETLQAFAALRLQLRAAQRIATPDAFARAVAEALGQIDTEIANLRALITELRPAALDELGVTAAIDALCERAHARGVEVQARVGLRSEAGRESTRLAPDLETAIYRITQEALTNAQKHGGATVVEVAIDEGEAEVSVLVRDNGSGFDVRSRSGGFGLVGMRERAELLGGRLDVRSTPGAGTEVRAGLPVVRSTAADRVARGSGASSAA
jgi:two-component system, NarL family, sensor histidine kinase DevS